MTKYRQLAFVEGVTVKEAIDAAESKLILTALLDADWAKKEQGLGAAGPMMVFNMLGLTRADGWEPPMMLGDPDGYTKAARAWLKQHATTYRIQRIVRQ